MTNFIKTKYKMISAKIKSSVSGMTPALRVSLLVGIAIAAVVANAQLILLFKPYGFVPCLLFAGVSLIVTLLVSVLVMLLIAAIKRIHWAVTFVFIASVIGCITVLTLELYLIPLLIFSMAAVYLAIMCATGKYKGYSRFKKIVRGGLLALCSAGACAVLFLILWQGPSLTPSLRGEKAALALPYEVQLDTAGEVLKDPSLEGAYEVTTLYYATAGQKVDPYPELETIQTPSVDASGVVAGWSSVRTRQLGFTPEALPLNGQVWMPKGAGPFPLVLIVHGNHNAGERSDGGYAYIGELLASRGMIAVSVDENFLNSSPLYDRLVFTPLENENSARGVVLLEHLKQWYQWNEDASSTFFNKVDFENLALIGHSRGGEAVALAAAFSEMDYYPGNGRVTFDYPFRIKTVIAIAPVHSTDSMVGLEVALKNVNYLVIHGGHDMDVSSFMGNDMYHKADVTQEGIKASVWMKHANHGQFNSAWGKRDVLGLLHLMYNERMLMPMDEQQQAAKVFISAFLESTLHDQGQYNSLFKRFKQGADWLPATWYITDYADNQELIVDDYDANYEIGSSSSDLVSYSAQGFELWTVAALPSKYGDKSNRVLTLTWEDKAPVFQMEFKEGAVSTGDDIFVSLCSGNPSAEAIRFDIKLTDREGNTAVVDINEFGGVVNPLEVTTAKPLFSALTDSSEPVLQAVCIPTERFEGLSGEIVSMEWTFKPVNGENGEQTLYADDLRVEKRP